jgi:predicted RNA-binding Zn-ribbon protein involved in translation (DUF1610 family)
VTIIWMVRPGLPEKRRGVRRGRRLQQRALRALLWLPSRIQSASVMVLDLSRIESDMALEVTLSVACPECRSALLREILRIRQQVYYKCEECGHLFAFALPEPAPPRERRATPRDRRVA